MALLAGPLAACLSGRPDGKINLVIPFSVGRSVGIEGNHKERFAVSTSLNVLRLLDAVA